MPRLDFGGTRGIIAYTRGAVGRRLTQNQLLQSNRYILVDGAVTLHLW